MIEVKCSATPKPRPRLSLLLNRGSCNGVDKATKIYENVQLLGEQKKVTNMASSTRSTGIPVFKRPQTSFIHSTFKPTTCRQPQTTLNNKIQSISKNRQPRSRPSGSVDSDSSSSRCSSDSLTVNHVPSQMVATLTDQFNALIERRKVQQQQLKSVDSRLSIQKKTVEVIPVIRSCPSSPQTPAFTRGKWSSIGHSGISTSRGSYASTQRISSSTDSCDSTAEPHRGIRSSLKEEVKLTAVQRAARNYEVALKKTTSASSLSPTTSTNSKTSPSSVDGGKIKLTVKSPEIPLLPKRKIITSPIGFKEDDSVTMDLLAEIDRHLGSGKVNVVTNKQPNRSFLWKSSTQKRFTEQQQQQPKVETREYEDDDDDSEHLYEELSNFFSSHKGERMDVPLAVPENDSSSSSSSYGYAAASLSYSVARCSFKSSSSISERGNHKDILTEADAESDGGSWADDSDDEGQQWCKGQVKKTWAKHSREGEMKSSGEVQSGGEGMCEEEEEEGSSENIYEPLTEPDESNLRVGGGKKVKRNWSWSKTRTEFHLDISSKLSRNKKPEKPRPQHQNHKWAFKTTSNEKDSRKMNGAKSPIEKEASAQFYVPSSSSSSESKVNLDFDEANSRRSSSSSYSKRSSVIIRPTTAPPLPPVQKQIKDTAKEASDDDNSSKSSESTSEAKENEEPRRFLYLDDTYYIDEDHKKLSPFNNEPLYQFYTMAAQQRAAHENQVDSSDDDCYESIYQVTTAAVIEDDDAAAIKPSDDESENKTLLNVPSAMELVRLTEGGVRTLWCEVPEVVASGVLETTTIPHRNLQEAMFEVITSEASYLKSLNILINHFMMCPVFLHEFSSSCVLSKRERHVLFSDVIPVKETSERLLEALEKRWQESILITDICDIILFHATKYFDVYVKYCSNQLYQDRCIKKLKESSSEFVEVLRRLESSPMCQGLSMYSFLMLPMQRITRLPLLIDAIFNRLDALGLNHDTCRQALATLNKIVHECNEGAQHMARMEEMLNISRQLDFRMFKGLPLISASRWLIKKGELVRLLLGDSCKLSFGRSRCPKQVVHLFLFTDVLIVTKKKSDDCYHVVDYCPRNMLQVTEGPDQLPDRLLPDGCRNLFQLTMLQNHGGKTVEMFFSCPMESDRTRWVEAIAPKKSDDPDEKVYEEWDCPQVQAIHNYSAQQPDELSLEESDVVNVFRKMADGWFQGERIRDGSKGWFPSNYTVEIVSSHVRARNLRQRYRLLALSKSYLEEQRKKESKLKS